MLERDGYRIEKIALGTAPDITVPALVFVPEGGPARKPAILYVDGAGKGAQATEGGDIEALARSGHVVLAPDPRGVGESQPTSASGGYRPVWQMLQRALLVDRTIVGLQVEDLLAVFEYLAGREDVDPDRIARPGAGLRAASSPWAWRSSSRRSRRSPSKGPSSPTWRSPGRGTTRTWWPPSCPGS